MIYLLYGEVARERMGYPEIASISKNAKFEDLRFTERAMADFIFAFEGGKTVYLKNRHDAPPRGRQFTEEERLIIVLKAVPL